MEPEVVLPAYHLALGDTIGAYPYVITTLLNRACKGMAEVYLANVNQPMVQLQETDTLVIKIAAPTKLESNNQGIRNEERLLPALQHRGIIKMLPIWRIDQQKIGYRARAALPGDPWFCLFEFLSGGSVADLLQHHEHGLPGATVIALSRALAAALDYLHQRQLVHMDVKPSNILFRTKLHQSTAVDPVLIDFGIARQTGQASAAGTIGYLAPERQRQQNQAAPVTYAHPSMDIYAFGVVCYELLTGQRPDTKTPLPPSHFCRYGRQRRLVVQYFEPWLLTALSQSWQARPTASAILGELSRAEDQRRSWHWWR